MTTVTVRVFLSVTLVGLLSSAGAFAQDKPSNPPPFVTIPTLVKPPLSPVQPVIKLPPSVILTKPPITDPIIKEAAKGEPEAAPAQDPAPAAATALALPYRASTSAIEVIGAPEPPAVGVSPDFRPLRVATSAIEVIGNASVPPPPAGPFSPLRVRTEPIEIIGTN